MQHSVGAVRASYCSIEQEVLWLCKCLALQYHTNPTYSNLISRKTNHVIFVSLLRKSGGLAFTIYCIGPMRGTELRGWALVVIVWGLSLEPSWHSKPTMKQTPKQQRRGEEKQNWHWARTRSWEVNDLLQGAKPSELSRDPAHMERRRREWCHHKVA